jgi:hypothetical protein
VNKSLKRVVVFVLLISIVLSYALNKNVIAQVPNYNGVHLILDAFKNNDTLPKNFRKTTDLKVIKNSKDVILNGLDKLNISGSDQFSGNNLKLLLDTIDTSLPITVIDLREESHGFINGYAVSWANSKNNANLGLNREQVLLDETDKLKSIKLNEPITFYNSPK